MADFSLAFRFKSAKVDAASVFGAKKVPEGSKIQISDNVETLITGTERVPDAPFFSCILVVIARNVIIKHLAQ